MMPANRAGDLPGLTEPLPLLRQRERTRRDCCRRLFCLRRFFYEVSSAILGPLLLYRRTKSKPFTPWVEPPAYREPASAAHYEERGEGRRYGRDRRDRTHHREHRDAARGHAVQQPGRSNRISGVA